MVRYISYKTAFSCGHYYLDLTRWQNGFDEVNCENGIWDRKCRGLLDGYSHVYTIEEPVSVKNKKN
jgi:hypothetical protein